MQENHIDSPSSQSDPKSEMVKIKTALISVSDRAGLDELCRTLHKFGVTLYATGGTAKHIEDTVMLPVHKVESLTQFPEMMDGRVKTLHPKIFGGILARRDHPKDLEEARTFEIPLFDLVIVNLYPFPDHLGKPPKKQSSFVDIGGPSLIRAAAKNFVAVTVASDPADYAELAQELTAHQGSTTILFRHKLAARSFQRTSEYDALIASEWSDASEFPKIISLGKVQVLRYGENPHQKGAWAGPAEEGWKVLQGKELSYNNLLDAQAAAALVSDFRTPAVAIVKHNNPCGASAGDLSGEELFKRALAADDKSAFGGIVAFNMGVDDTAAEALSTIFLEVVIAPEFTPEALIVLAKKKNLRLIEVARPLDQKIEIRAALGGWLLQDRDNRGVPANMKVVTAKPIPTECWDDLKFAWLVSKHVRSNAIVIAKGGTTLSVGAGQMSRVDAVNIALGKLNAEQLKGAVLASDAFFPFRDNIDLLQGYQIAAVIQPGGSQRDQEVIDACNELGIAMVFTGERHFRH